MPLQPSQGGIGRCLRKTSLIDLLRFVLASSVGKGLQPLELTLMVQLSLRKVILQ